VPNSGRQSLPPNAIKAILQFTATPLPGVDELTQGAGSLNPVGAIELTRSIDPTRAVGSWWLVRDVNPATALRNGETLLWGQKVIWRDAIVWGNTIDWESISPEAVVWGNGMAGNDPVF
jgi:hypothetical protein